MGAVVGVITLFSMNYLEQFKYVMCSIISGMLSLFFPIRDFMYAMLIVFGVNYIFGLVAGLKHGEKWELRKSMVFFYHCALFFVMTASIFVTGYFLHAGDETLGVVKALCGGGHLVLLNEYRPKLENDAH